VEHESVLEYQKRIWNIYNAGLIAISIVVLQVFLSGGNLDGPAIISVCSLATAVPILAGCTLFVSFAAKKSDLNNRWFNPLFAIGASSALIGIAAALFHVSWIACVLFVASAFVTSIIVIVAAIKGHFSPE
jgi:amino acid transporter